MMLQEQLDDLRRKVEEADNPRLAPLRGALREWHTILNCQCYASCSAEHPGYVTRDVSGWPEWAVKGLVLGAALESELIDDVKAQNWFVAGITSGCIAAVSEAVGALRKEKHEAPDL